MIKAIYVFCELIINQTKRYGKITTQEQKTFREIINQIRKLENERKLPKIRINNFSQMKFLT